jgi:hypothetical protein
MNTYILHEINWSRDKEPQCLDQVRARTPKGAARQVKRKLLYFETHESHGKSFTCNDNQWLVWGTGANFVVWLELIPDAKK